MSALPEWFLVSPIVCWIYGSSLSILLPRRQDEIDTVHKVTGQCGNRKSLRAVGHLSSSQAFWPTPIISSLFSEDAHRLATEKFGSYTSAIAVSRDEKRGRGFPEWYYVTMSPVASCDALLGERLPDKNPPHSVNSGCLSIAYSLSMTQFYSLLIIDIMVIFSIRNLAADWMACTSLRVHR